MASFPTLEYRIIGEFGIMGGGGGGGGVKTFPKINNIGGGGEGGNDTKTFLVPI